MPLINAATLTVSDGDRERLERMACSMSQQLRTVQQAKALILVADGSRMRKSPGLRGWTTDAVRRGRLLPALALT